MSAAPPKKIKLPPLRNGITFAFNDYDLEGKPQWLIHDAAANRFFLIGWLEYEILSRWHMGDPEEILESILNETTLHVEMSDLENFFKFLSSHFLLKQSGYQILGTAKQQNVFRDENIIHWLIGHYLFFRIPLCKPDKFLVRTAIFGKILFSRYTAMFMLVLAGIALYQLSNRWEIFTHTFHTIFTLQGMFFYMIAFSFCKLLHEMGHAYMCRRYGIPVPTLGLAFLVFWPVLYTDTTLSWSLNSRQRLKIAIAGMWIESYTVILAALLWCNSGVFVLQSIAYLVISIHWAASMLINVSPFMRFDGYYVLADLMRMPNLQPRAFALTRWQIRRWLFHWPDPPPEKFGLRLHLFLVTYSFVTWLYRLVIYVGIAVMVYHFFIKIGGIILFIIEMFYFILGPFLSEVRFWIFHREKFSLNLHTQVTLFLTLMLLLLFFLPVNQSVRIPATLSYYHQLIFSPEAGILATSLPPVGTIVHKNEMIATIRSPWLEEAMREVMLDYNKSLNELRRAKVNSAYSDETNVLLSDINKERSEYDKLQQRRERLIIKAPFDGRIAETPLDLQPGTTLQQDQWLGDVVTINQLTIQGYVAENDLSRIHPGQKGYFYPLDLGQPSVPVTVRTIEIMNTKELNCHYGTAIKSDKAGNYPLETPCYHISEFGGTIPVYVTDTQSYVPVNSVYLVLLETKNTENIPFIQKGTVIVNASPRSLASRLLYWGRKTIIEQSGF